jgi:hypothetical protein
MKKSNLISLISGLAIAALFSCGGGGGGGGSTATISVQPSTDYQGTYTGAASAGDFAVYDVQGNRLSYQVKGPIFGQISGNLTLQPLAIDANSTTHFWKASVNGTNVYVFLSKNLGLAYIPDLETADGSTVNATILGLRNATNIQNIIGKSFVYVDIRTNTGISYDGCVVNINGNSTSEVGNFTYECLNSGSGQGCWKLDLQNNRLIAVETTNTTDCTNQDYNNPDFYVVAKPGSSRAGFILDHADGSGIGVGLEQKSYTTDLDTTKIYVFETLDWDDNDNPIEATVKVYYNNTSGQWQYTWQSSQYNSSGKLYLDTYCDEYGNTNPMEGVICAYNENSGNYWDVMLDPVDGYYIAICVSGNCGVDDNIEVGALKYILNNNQ